MATSFDANDPTASGMVLTFDDEFNSNDTSNTGVASGAQWANHLWYQSANPGAVSVADGVLSLAANGELETVNSSGQGFAQTYGYFEIDMKVPSGVGTWPAFWMMSQQHVVNGSAPAAEIDAIEGQGNKPYGYYTTLHYNTGGGGSAGPDQVNPMPNYAGDVSSTPLSDGYHRYGVLWSPDSNQITYYFDGKPISSSTVYSTTNSSPVMVLIDNWLGDIGWGGNSPTGQSYGPLNVDYVRAYQFSGQNPTAVAAQAVSPAAGQTDPTALASADGHGGSVTPPSDPPPSDPPPVNNAGPESANDTVVADTSHSIATAAGNVFGIDATGHVMLNGVSMPETHGVTELAYVGHTLYQEATSSNLWFSYNEASHSWSAPVSNPLPAGSTTPPADPPPMDPPPTTPTESANDTVVTDTGHSVTTAAGNVFGIDATGHVMLNGVAMPETHGVTELAYAGHTLYQEATSSNLWFSYNEASHSWSAPVSNPLP
ncbi:MAG: glycoside hydrolase family 16 protein, partial [Stellaceae bacterium]